jgi:hypothetical protein
MKLEVKIGGRLRELEVSEPDGVWQSKLDGKSFSADAKEVCEGIYSVLIAGRAYEVRVEPLRQGLRLSVGARENENARRDSRAQGRKIAPAAGGRRPGSERR